MGWYDTLRSLRCPGPFILQWAEWVWSSFNNERDTSAFHCFLLSFSHPATWFVRTLWLTSPKSLLSTAAAWKRDMSPAWTPERTPSSDTLPTFIATLINPASASVGVSLHPRGSSLKEDNLCYKVSAPAECLMFVRWQLMSSVTFSSLATNSIEIVCWYLWELFLNEQSGTCLLWSEVS